MTTFCAAAAIFSVTAHWWGIGSIDTTTVSKQAWNLVQTGTIYGDGPVGPGVSLGGVASQPAAGIILSAAIPQLLMAWSGINAVIISVAAAVLLTAATTANMAVVLSGWLGRSRGSVIALTIACSTGLWSIASAELWTHTVDAFWLSVLLLLLHAGRYNWAGLAVAPAVFVRPHLAVVALFIGLGIAWERRSWWTLATAGLPAALALWLTRAANGELLGASAVSGPYSYAVGNATSADAAALRSLIENIGGSLISPYRGLFIFTPLALLAIPAIRDGLRSAPRWTLWTTAGGVAYTLIQLRINHFSGGSAFYGNRYLIELTVLATPLLVFGWSRWVAQSTRRRMATRLLAATSMTITATGSLLAGSSAIYEPADHPWDKWLTFDVLQGQMPTGPVLIGSLLLLACAWAILAGKQPPGDVRHAG